MLRTHADLPELSALRDEARNTVHESKRRRVATVVAAAVAAIVLLIVATLSQTHRGNELMAMLQGEQSYSTMRGERARVILTDGSVVTLDSDTRLTARLSGSRRDVVLLAGRALFEVAKDPKRPFVVKAGQQTITALGTVFDVRLSPRELRVTLAEGKVAVRPVSGQGSPAQILKPHQQLVIVTGVASPELRTVDTDNALNWADQQIFFEDERLASAIDEMNRYSQRKISVDPAAADLRINGMFRVGNQARFIEALKIALPVDVRAGDAGGLIVSRRPGQIAGHNDTAM